MIHDRSGEFCDGCLLRLCPTKDVAGRVTGTSYRAGADSRASAPDCAGGSGVEVSCYPGGAMPAILTTTFDFAIVVSGPCDPHPGAEMDWNPVNSWW